jgi:hypothetical protein
MAKSSVLDSLRSKYHRAILQKILGLRKATGKPCYSNADSASPASRAIAERIAVRLTSKTGQQPCHPPPKEQTAGTVFAALTKDFLDQAFAHLHHLRPGKWLFSASQDKAGITRYYQYEHLADLQALLQQHPELRATIGGDYLVVPDITIARQPVYDSEINIGEKFVCDAEFLGKYTPLRASVNTKSILHASVSCKWTIRMISIL